MKECNYSVVTRSVIIRYLGYTHLSHINYKSYTVRYVYFKLELSDLIRLKIYHHF